MSRRIGVVLLGLALLTGAVGCEKPLILQDHFNMIEVGQTNSAEVLDILPEGDTMQSGSVLSVYREEGYSGDAGLIRFNPTDSLVKRKSYIQQRSVQVFPLFFQEKTNLLIQTMVDQDVLDEPYENEHRKNMAILNYCYQALASDVRSFDDDQKMTSYMGLARDVLGTAMIKLQNNPRGCSELGTVEGYEFKHPTLGASRVKLMADSDTIYTAIVETGTYADPLVPF